MSKTVTINLKGQCFTLTCAELQQHVLACCDAGLMHFGTAAHAASFVDRTQGHRNGHFFSGQRDDGENEPDTVSVDY